MTTSHSPSGTPSPSGASSHSPKPWDSLPAGGHDIRLVVCDMDGTLLAESQKIPETFWEVEKELERRGGIFVPASGRQYATLANMFPGSGYAFIAENGALVMRDGEMVSVTELDRPTIEAAVTEIREAQQTVAPNTPEAGVWNVLSGTKAAYVETDYPVFRTEAAKYYHETIRVDDLLAVDDDIIKVATCAFNRSEEVTEKHIAQFRGTHQVVVASEHWVDIMTAGVDKATAVRAIQKKMGITPQQTAVFGDYLNDYGMMSEGYYSFAMANAHPDMFGVANFIAPANTEDGVVRVLRHLMGV